MPEPRPLKMIYLLNVFVPAPASMIRVNDRCFKDGGKRQGRCALTIRETGRWAEKV